MSTSVNLLFQDEVSPMQRGEGTACGQLVAKPGLEPTDMPSQISDDWKRQWPG